MKISKTRKMLSDWNAPYIQSLMKLIETQSKLTLANWAVDYSEQFILPLWSKRFPDDAVAQAASLECSRMETALRSASVDNEPDPAKIDWKCKCK